MSDLITLAELKAARGESLTDTSNDARYNWLIDVASALIRNFTGRDFGAAALTEERTYQYDGSGYLDIDDASSISSVVLVTPNADDLPLDADYQWYAQPPRRDDSPVFTYLVLPGLPGSPGFSPEMGFSRNLDVYYREHRMPSIPTTLKVTGVWGWPIVPTDVKQAAVWCIEEWTSRDGGEGLSAEAIADYSRSYGRTQNMTAEAAALPSRALDVLASYIKIQV